MHASIIHELIDVWDGERVVLLREEDLHNLCVGVGLAEVVIPATVPELTVVLGLV